MHIAKSFLLFFTPSVQALPFVDVCEQQVGYKVRLKWHWGRNAHPCFLFLYLVIFILKIWNRNGKYNITIPGDECGLHRSISYFESTNKIYQWKNSIDSTAMKEAVPSRSHFSWKEATWFCAPAGKMLFFHAVWKGKKSASTATTAGWLPEVDGQKVKRWLAVLKEERATGIWPLICSPRCRRMGERAGRE